MPRCVSQAIPLSQRKLLNRGNRFFFFCNVLEQVERSTQHQLKTTFPRIMGETVPGTGTGVPMQTQPC